MKYLVIILLLMFSAAEAQIYRCDGPQGVEFSDRPCGEDAEVVTLAQETSGVSIGPSEEVREALARKREQRAADRAAQAQARAAAPPPAQVQIIERPVATYPAFWSHRPGARPPHNRPGGGRPDRPRPPIEPPQPPPQSGNVLRPRD